MKRVLKRVQLLALLPEGYVAHEKRLAWVAYRAESLRLRMECVEADNIL